LWFQDRQLFMVPNEDERRIQTIKISACLMDTLAKSFTNSHQKTELDLHEFVHHNIITKAKNKMQLCRLIYYSLSALHVSGDVFAHHQEHLTVFTASGNIHQCRCRLTSRQRHWWILPDDVNTVKCSWWCAKTSPETCRADKE